MIVWLQLIFFRNCGFAIFSSTETEMRKNTDTKNWHDTACLLQSVLHMKIPCGFGVNKYFILLLWCGIFNLTCVSLWKTVNTENAFMFLNIHKKYFATNTYTCIVTDLYCGHGSSLNIASKYQNSYHLFTFMKVYVNNLCPVFLYYLSEHVCGVRY